MRPSVGRLCGVGRPLAQHGWGQVTTPTAGQERRLGMEPRPPEDNAAKWWASKTRPHPTVDSTFQFVSAIVAQTFRSLKFRRLPAFSQCCGNVVVVSHALLSEIGD